jgi:hypothetical protein
MIFKITVDTAGMFYHLEITNHNHTCWKQGKDSGQILSQNHYQLRYRQTVLGRMQASGKGGR